MLLTHIFSGNFDSEFLRDIIFYLDNKIQSLK